VKIEICSFGAPLHTNSNARAKRFLPLPVWKAIQNFSGFIPSHEQTHWQVWWGPAIRQQSSCCRRCYVIQVSEYLLDDHGIFDAGNDPDITAAFTAGFNINIENPLQPLCPGHGCAAFCWSLVLSGFCCYRFLSFTSFGWCYQCPVLAIGRKHPVKADEVNSGPGNQSDQSGDKVQWLKYDMRGAVVPRCFQLIADLTIAGQ